MSTEPPAVAEMLNTIAERCCSCSLDVNDPRLCYEDVPVDAMWRMVVFWRTPIVSEVYEAATLDKVVEAVWRAAQERGPWSPPYDRPPTTPATFDEIRASLDDEVEQAVIGNAVHKSVSTDDDGS